MTAFLLTWKEGILFASLIIFLFTPWSRSLRRYILLGLLIYLLNKPLIAHFHPGDMAWWLRNPTAWITAVTWLGGLVVLIRWLQGIKGQGVLSALSKISWQSHLIALALIILALFLFHLPEISPQFKTQADFSFIVVLINIPLQYLIGSSLLRTYDETIQSPLFLSLIGVALCVLVISLVPLYGTITQYRALLSLSPSKEKAVELIGQWEALLERNSIASVSSIRMTAYGRIGDLKLSLSDRDGALQWYKKALRDDPDDVAGSLGLARLLIREGRRQEAREALQGVIQRNPSLSWERLTKLFPPLQFQEVLIAAESLEAEGRSDEAFHAYRRALEMNPQNPLVNFRVGRIYFVRGDYDKAGAALQKTLSKLPRHLYALSYLIDLYENEGKIDQAQKYRDIIMKEIVTHHILPSDWRGKHGGRLYGKGGCHATIKLYKGRVKFAIQSRGTPAQGVWPHMVVRLDDEIIGETDVTSKEWRHYSFTTDVQTGEYTLWAYFTNDLCVVKKVDGKEIREDRNLFVGGAEMTFVK